MAKVFLSYRREDSASASDRIYDRLALRFGRENVFKDVDDIPSGVPLGNYIQDSLRRCSAAVVVIGPRWLDAQTPEGYRRLDDPRDLVRLEVETAFALGLRVIPVLVDGAEMPNPSTLPPSLQVLTQVTGIQVRNDPDFTADAELLVSAVEQAMSGPSLPFVGRQPPISQAMQTPAPPPLVAPPMLPAAPQPPYGGVIPPQQPYVGAIPPQYPFVGAPPPPQPYIGAPPPGMPRGVPPYGPAPQQPSMGTIPPGVSVGVPPYGPAPQQPYVGAPPPQQPFVAPPPPQPPYGGVIPPQQPSMGTIPPGVPVGVPPYGPAPQQWGAAQPWAPLPPAAAGWPPTTARAPERAGFSTRNLLVALAAVVLVVALVVGTIATLRGLINHPSARTSGGGGQTTTVSPNAAPDAQQVFAINEKGPYNGDLVRLDPQQLYYVGEYQIAKEIFVGLMTLDKNSKVVPDAASAMPTVSADGLTYTFKIRSNIKWSDGTQLTAQDFADAIARSQDPCINKGHPALVNYYLGGTINELLAGAHAEENMACPKNFDGTYPTALPSGSPIEGPGKAVEASDASTLVLRLSSAAPYFLAALTYPTSMPVEKSLLQAGGFNWSQQSLCAGAGNGSGPFKCVLWDHAGHLRLVRNDNYYGGKAKIREIDYNLYKDGEVAYADFKAGKGSLVYPPTDDVVDAKTRAGFQSVPLAGVDYYQPNWKMAPFNNLDARIAFDAAINRNTLANTVLHGAVKPTINYIVQGLPGYNPNLTTSWGASGAAALNGDVSAAQSHMQKYVAAACSGDITKCPKVVLPYRQGNPSAQNYAQALLQMWQTAFPNYGGADGLSLVAVDASSLINNCSQYQVPPIGWIMDYPADEDWYDNLLEANAGLNCTGINVPSADQLASQGNVTVDPTAAEPLYRQAEEDYVSQVAWIVTDQIMDNYVTAAHVTGYSENDSGVIAPESLLAFYITQ